ncbi:MAG: hypothetical protein V4664_00095, partial [Patescibacteria group bacterium]
FNDLLPDSGDADMKFRLIHSHHPLHPKSYILYPVLLLTLLVGSTAQQLQALLLLLLELQISLEHLFLEVLQLLMASQLLESQHYQLLSLVQTTIYKSVVSKNH